MNYPEYNRAMMHLRNLHGLHQNSALYFANRQVREYERLFLSRSVRRSVAFMSTPKNE